MDSDNKYNSVNPEIESELKAYAYQKISEIEDFFQGSDTKTIIFKKLNIKKMLKRLRQEDELSYDILKDSKVCYSFIVQDGSFKIKAYGYGINDFEALDNAKYLLEKKMIELNDEAVSTKDRNLQINRLLNKQNQIH